MKFKSNFLYLALSTNIAESVGIGLRGCRTKNSNELEEGIATLC
jgi:hypothetical protein